MRIWADISNASGTALGRITSLRDAYVSRALDGAGQFSFSLPLTDDKAQTLLQVERRVTLYTLDGDNIREVGRGIITKLGVTAASSGWMRTVSGVDELNELKRTSTLLGRKYDNQQVQAIASDLATLVSGWTSSSSITDTTIARFDGESVLKALQMLAEQSGNHIRLGSSAKTFELGAFGTDSGIRAINRQRVTHDLYSNDNVVLIESFRQESDSGQMFNWLLPLMSGMGEAAIGLEHSTRTSPYTIQTTTGPDGRTLYYIADSTSVASYGTIQRVAKFQQIAPLSNSATALELASNALYDAAVAQLQRFKDPQQVYSVTLRKVTTNLSPGDKIRVRYKGFVENTAGDVVNYVDVDNDFWILDVTERFGVEGKAVDLKISDIDRRALSTAEVIVGKLDSMIVNGLRVEPYFSRDVFVDKFEIDSTHSATFQLDLTDAVQSTVRVQMRLITSPFRATATATEANADPISFAGVSSGAPATEPVYWRNFRMYDGTAMVNHALLYPDATAEDTYQTRPGTDDTHTHDMTYGIIDDTEYPSGITITINGTDRTNALTGSATIAGGSAVDTTLDITDYINANANNTIVIACGSGQGLAKVIVEEYLVIQTIRVS